jgi:twinkle protein
MSVTKEPCPKCLSADNLARYEEDGHAHCFTPGCGYREPATGERAVAVTAPKFEPVMGDCLYLEARCLGVETCTKWRYQVGEYKGKPVHIANYYDDRELVAQKLRFADKTFAILGDAKRMKLYGEWLWRDGGKMVVVTEGEIDALSVSQAQGNKWPVVSIPNGAQAASKAIKGSLEWLEKFESVVLMFDNDEHGIKAAKECAGLFTPGKCKIASLPRKDANDMVKHGEERQLIDAIWGAKEYRPDGIVTLKDLRAELLKPVQWGRPWVYDTLTKATYGRRDGEVYAIGAGTGVGKTDFLTEQIAYDVDQLRLNVGVIFLEQPPAETLKRIAGKMAGKRFHVPDAGWTADDLDAAVTRLESSGQLYLYDHFGSMEWATIKQRIRYMVVSLGCQHVYLDHLTALAAAAEDERKALEAIMADLSGMTQELKFVLHFVSHLATPEGKPHEEGGRVMIRHFKGSRAIGFWSHFMFGLERDQQAEDMKVRHTTVFRILKDRYTGQSTGNTFFLGYDAEKGRLHETTDNPFAGDEGDDSDRKSPF